MFHQGDLQSGIALAIQSSKLVACFVCDDSESSKIWEEEYFRDDQISSLLSSSTVLLRIQAQSQEARFLSAFCPIDTVPLLALIDKGQLRDVLRSSTDRDEIARRLRETVQSTLPPKSSSLTAALKASSTAQSSIPATAPSTASAANTAASSAPPANRNVPAQASRPENVQSTFNARRDRLDAERQRAEVASMAQRAARRAADSNSAASGGEPNYAALRRQRLAAERAERDRVLASIESDKAERRAREANRRAAVAAAANANADGDTALTPQTTPQEERASLAPSSSSSGRKMTIIVRVPDGSKVRNSFNLGATIKHDVRPWLDAELETSSKPTQEHSSTPSLLSRIGSSSSASLSYDLKLHEPPQQAKTISPADEALSLLGAGLRPPAANLVCVPKQSPIAIVGATGPAGERSRLRAFFSALISTLLAILLAPLKLLPRQSTTADRLEAPESAARRQAGGAAADIEMDSTTASAHSSGINVRTLQDQKRSEAKSRKTRQADGEKEDLSLYNGNQLSFEPRNDDLDAGDDDGSKDR